MKKIGVIVARFQVPSLHDGHIDLIMKVAEYSDMAIIFLGYKINQPDTKNPFSITVRKAMLESELKKLNLLDRFVIDTIEDHPVSSKEWSSDLDDKINIHKNNYETKFNNKVEVKLFGSRDSFLAVYDGKFQTEEIKPLLSTSGTQIRGDILDLKEDELNKENRMGMLYAMKHIYPVGMAVADILVYKKEGKDIYFLFGKKSRSNTYGLIGGFFDVDQDDSLESAAIRELKEEVGDVKVKNLKYVTSSKLNDWRYVDNDHKMVSSFFIAEYVSGDPVASDDIAEVLWVRNEDVEKFNVLPHHMYFINQARNSLI